MWVRCFWPDWRRGQDPDARLVDGLWVEVTAAEAEAAIFSYLSADAVAESKALAEERAALAEHPSPARPFCFLVARDLGFIEPHMVHYPFLCHTVAS
jgi:hypothetical protein